MRPIKMGNLCSKKKDETNNQPQMLLTRPTIGQKKGIKIQQ